MLEVRFTKRDKFTKRETIPKWNNTTLAIADIRSKDLGKKP